MKIAAVLTNARSRLTDLLCAGTWGTSVLLVVAGAYLTALSAQVKVPLPFTPVPITGQVLAVLLIGGLLRPRLAIGSQLLYVAAGACGLPWYAGGGYGYQFGPNGGFILGFIGAAWLVAALVERPWFRASVGRIALAMLAGLAVIYLFGAAQFALVMTASLRQTLVMAVAPFVLGDAIKIAVASSVVYAVRRSR